MAPMTVNADDKLLHFYNSVRQMYISGADVQVEKLYPTLSSNTSSLSHRVNSSCFKLEKPTKGCIVITVNVQ